MTHGKNHLKSQPDPDDKTISELINESFMANEDVIVNGVNGVNPPPFGGIYTDIRGAVISGGVKTPSGSYYDASMLNDITFVQKVPGEFEFWPSTLPDEGFSGGGQYQEQIGMLMKTPSGDSPTEIVFIGQSNADRFGKKLLFVSTRINSDGDLRTSFRLDCANLQISDYYQLDGGASIALATKRPTGSFAVDTAAFRHTSPVGSKINNYLSFKCQKPRN